MFLVEYLLIIFGEFYNIETEFGVSEVHKEYIFGLLLLLRQLPLLVKPVIQSNSCRFVDDLYSKLMLPTALGGLYRIHQGFSLLDGREVGHGYSEVLIAYVIEFYDLLDLAEKCRHCLLRGYPRLLALVVHLIEELTILFLQLAGGVLSLLLNVLLAPDGQIPLGR